MVGYWVLILAKGFGVLDGSIANGRFVSLYRIVVALLHGHKYVVEKACSDRLEYLVIAYEYLRAKERLQC